MTLSLRQRLLLSVTPLLLLLAGFGTVGIVLLVRLGQRSDAILHENYDSVRAMNCLTVAAERIDSAFRHALSGRETEARSEYHDHWEAYREELAIEAGNLTILPEEPRLFADLKALSDRYQSQGDRFFAEPAGNDQRREKYFGTAGRPGLRQTLEDIRKSAQAVHDLNERQMRLASSHAQETARNSVVVFAVGSGVAVLVSLLSLWWLHRTLLEPIRAVTAAATAIGSGELNQIVPVPGRDEVGRLADAFNSMTRKLRAYRQSNTDRLLRARQTGQATIDSFPDPVVVVDTLGRIESANPAAQRVLGVKPPSDGEPLAVWTPPESLRQQLEDVLRRQPTLPTEMAERAVTFRLDGEDRVYIPRPRPIWSPEGELLGAAVVLNDVTRYLLLDRLKSDWVATVSHELKTPLTSVRLAVHVLLEEVVGPLEPKQVELLLEARENTERLLKLIDHLLSLAELEDGRQRLDLKPTNPHHLLRAAAEDASARAEDRRIEIVVEAEPGLPLVAADAARLGRALSNLVDNAISDTEPGGRITLAASVLPDGAVGLTVSDTGIGIPAEYLPHVFERFFRVPGRDRRPGTGLGLAIVREVVSAHAGEIHCESEPGRGTTFRIHLPAAGQRP